MRIPLGALTAVTGVSGSGKSSLIEDVLYNSLARTLHRATNLAAPHDAIRGVEMINKVIRVDQQPLGNTPTSNPATYTGVFELIRALYSELPDAKLRGYTPRRFSFNVPGGRCEKCEGNGQLRIEMHFLPDVWVECDECRGRRYNPETLAVRFTAIRSPTCSTCRAAGRCELFKNIPKIRRVLETLCDVGLDYLRLGQPAPTLSGGEAQRVKLAAELARPDTGQTLYLLDEPTTGLHFDDLARLLDVLNRLVDLGNTVVVIEHNLDVIKTADWIIDMGPEAGEAGGHVVVAGTPEQVVAHALAAAAPAKSKRRQPRGAAICCARTRARCWRRCWPPVRTSNASCSTSPRKKRSAKRTWKSTRSAAKRRCRGKPTAAAGTRAIASDARASPAGGMARSWRRVVDRVQELGRFAPTNWNNRTIVEITGEKKTDGWFLHAVTGEEWLLQLKFRVAKKSFQRDDLVARLDLKPLNEIHELPVYGSEPRVKCKNLRGPWQEVQIARALAARDRPARVLEIPERGRGRLPTLRRACRAAARGRYALESARAEMASIAQGFSAGQAYRLGSGSAGGPVRATGRDRQGRPVPVEQSAGGTRLPARRRRAVGHDPYQAASRHRPVVGRAEGTLRAGPHRQPGRQSGIANRSAGQGPGEAALRRRERSHGPRAGRVPARTLRSRHGKAETLAGAIVAVARLMRVQ